MNRKKTLTTLLLVISVLMITGFSYAYIGGALSNANKQTASITTGTMTLVFADGTSTLAAKEINIGESITKTFTVENTGTLEATASMYFKDLVNTYITDSMSYRLEYATSESGTYNVLKEETNVPRSSTAAEELLYGEITVPAGTKYYYKLIITFNNLPEIDQTPDLDAVLNTKFTLKAGHSTAYWLALEGYPLTLPSSMGLNLKDYKIYGNSVQNGTPTPNAPVEVESVGEKTKNLFDKNNAKNGTMMGDTGAHIETQTNRCITDFIYLEAGNYTYSIYGEIQAGNTHFFSEPNETTKIGNVMPTVTTTEVSTVSTFTVPIDCYIRTVFLPLDETKITNLNTDLLKTYEIMLEKGSTKTEYEPYGYKIPVKVSNDNEDITTNIYLDEPLRKIGEYTDYIDFNNMKVVRAINEIKLSEKTWSFIYDGKNAEYSQFYSKIEEGNKSSNLMGCYSTHFAAKTREQIWQGAQGISCSDNYARISQDVDTKWNNSTEEFKNWLKTNEALLIYVNSEKIEETIELPNIPTLEGSTTIELVTDVIPSNMSVFYKSS